MNAINIDDGLAVPAFLKKQVANTKTDSANRN
jgi:hypothetical protein